MPRRCQLEHLTAPELCIRQAVLAVEAAGAHPLLTDAVSLLQQAREKVADFVELPTTEPAAAARPKAMHPATAFVLQFFAYEHLPPHLQAVSKPFGDLARKLAAELPENQETTAALRKLLEAKDCAVRSLVAK